MEGRKLLAAAVVAALLLMQPVHGQTGGSPAPIGLGFSEGTVAPVSDGVPVYTVGDQLWFELYQPGNASISLTEPCASGTSASNNCTGWSFSDTVDYSRMQLFTFSSADPDGLWTLTVFTGGNGWAVQFYLVAGGAPLRLSGYGISDSGQLSMNYTLGSGSAYAISGCAVGNRTVATAYIPIPTTLGSRLLLTLNGSSVSAIPQGSPGPFTVWLNISQDYSFQLNNETVVSREMQVAETQPVQVSGGLTGAFSTALQESLPLRTGQYTLAVNFEDSQGVSVQETTVLITGTGSWVWLQDCQSTSESLSNSLELRSSLQDSPSLWPRYVYVLYKELGVSLYTVTPVSLQPATLSLVASPWNQSLTDSQIGVSGTPQNSAGNGTVYLAAGQFPIQVLIETAAGASKVVEVSSPYTSTVVSVPAERIVVGTINGGSDLSGVRVSLTDAQGAVAVENSTGGEATFFVPPGDYNVTGSFEGSTVSLPLVGGPQDTGESLQLTMQFGMAGPGWLALVLLVALGVGVIASGTIWAFAYRRRRRVKLEVAAAPPMDGPEK